MDDDAGIWEVTLEAANFDVTFFTDDDRQVAICDEFGEFGMSDFDKGAGGIGDAIASVFPAFTIFISCAVSGDDDVWSGGGFTSEISSLCSLRGEAGFYAGVVSEFTEDGGGFLREEGLGCFESLLNAEAHAGVFCDEDLISWSLNGLHLRPQDGCTMWRLDEAQEKKW